MCGRFLFTSPPEAVSSAFGIDVRDNFPPRYNVAPTQPIAVIHVDEQTPIAQRAPSFALMRWGFVPGWAKKDWHERMKGKPLINARSETVAEKPTFRSAWKRRRCLVPADGFYEWKRERNEKQPYCIKPREEGLLAFGAIWETAHDPDGGEIDTVAILTCAAGPDLEPLHHREPIVIDRTDFEAWLEPETTDLRYLPPLEGRPAGFWQTYQVSKDVSNARNEGAHLSEPAGQGQLL